MTLYDFLWQQNPNTAPEAPFTLPHAYGNDGLVRKPKTPRQPVYMAPGYLPAPGLPAGGVTPTLPGLAPQTAGESSSQQNPFLAALQQFAMQQPGSDQPAVSSGMGGLPVKGGAQNPLANLFYLNNGGGESAPVFMAEQGGGDAVGPHTSSVGPQENILQDLFKKLSPSVIQLLLGSTGNKPGGITSPVNNALQELFLHHISRAGENKGNATRLANRMTNLFDEASRFSPLDGGPPKDPRASRANTWTRLLSEASAGRTPQAIQTVFDRNLAEKLAGIQESFGASGARFGTDLAGTLGDYAGKATNELAANSLNRAFDAGNQILAMGQLGAQTEKDRLSILASLGETASLAQARARGQDIDTVSQILGLGRGNATMEFTRSENALNRALQEFLASLQGDMLLKELLGGMG